MQADISTLEALLRRVKKADGPDRELDLAIAVALVPDVLVSIHDRETGTNKPHTYWQYTASIDAALALVQEKLPGWFVSLDINGKNIGNFARVYNDGLVHEPSFTSTGNKPIELVALAAILRALLQEAV